MVINSSGNVGIGTTGPAAKLEISSAATTTDINKITSTALTSGKALYIAATGNGFTSGNLLNANLTQAAATGTSVSGDIVNIAFAPTYSTAITTPEISGNILDVSRTAVTNTDFASTLTVSGAVAIFSDSATQTQGTLTSTADVVQISQNYNANTGAALNITTAGGAGSFALRVNDNGTLTDSTAFVVDSSGNVGIGTTGPTEKLEVVGNVLVTGGSFIDDGTTLSAPDYVFDVDYHLPTLSELKDFIGLNKHLPNVPAMDDTAGWAALSLQERDMRLLEKVEENVLYTLGLDGKIGEIGNEVADLREIGEIRDKRITENETQIANLKSQIQNSNVKTDEATPSAQAQAAYDAATTPSPTPEATESATQRVDEETLRVEEPDLTEYEELTIKETLTSVGKTYLADTNIAGTLTVGLITFDELENSIDSLSGPLKLQSHGQENLEIMAGKVVVDTEGNLEVFGEVTAKKFNVKIDKAENASAGQVAVPAGETRVEVETTALTENSLIFATPERPVAVGAKRVAEGKFELTLKEAESGELTVSWWIVN
jgi:hypothetical protein